MFNLFKQINTLTYLLIRLIDYSRLFASIILVVFRSQVFIFFLTIYTVLFFFISVYVMLLLAVLVTIAPSAFNKFGLVWFGLIQTCSPTMQILLDV